MKKDLKIDDYKSIAKSDISTYIVMTIVIFGILLFIGYKVDFYYILFLGLIMPFRVLERINAYSNIKLIKAYLVNNNLIDKIGTIDFWNEKNYFLTTNYLIIVNNKKVYPIKYNQISKISVEKKLNTGKNTNYQEYIHIYALDKDFKILTYSTSLVGEELLNLKKYLLNKNSKIQYEGYNTYTMDELDNNK